MIDIKRYDISYSERYGFDKEEDPNGEYVEWEDHAAAIAAKDAEISQLRRDLKLSHAAYEQCEREITELRAQPASQGGGDEREQFNAWAKVKYPTADRKDALGGYARDLRKSALEGWNARAALAPAAVVMPGRKTRDPIDWDECSREMATDDAQFCGFNAALDEVARLNRRAIPLGLIESVCEDLAAELDAKYGDMKDHPVMSLSYRKDMADLNELRALLGKEGE